MKLSRLIVIVGAMLVVQVAALWMGANPAQADPNPSCTQACGSPNGVCVGTDSWTCPMCSYSSGSCTGTSTAWSNAVTKGSIMGSSTVTFPSIHCKTTWPCILGATNTGHHCDAGGCNCTSWFYDCYSCNLGAGTNYVYLNCTDGGCPEV